jgi:hypothetical protein
VRDEHIENLTSTDQRIDFWFSPSMRRSQRLNRLATELLRASTKFNAATFAPIEHFAGRPAPSSRLTLSSSGYLDPDFVLNHVDFVLIHLA